MILLWICAVLVSAAVIAVAAILAGRFAGLQDREVDTAHRRQRRLHAEMSGTIRRLR